MKFLLEVDGPVLDFEPAHYRAYREAAAAVGWSAVDAATWRRLVRTKGRDSAMLPGATPLKLKDFYARFEVRAEADDIVDLAVAQPWAAEVLAALRKLGVVSFLTPGRNSIRRRAKLIAGMLIPAAENVVSVEADPRQRAGQLRELSGGVRRCLVVAATDALIRAAREAELFSVGTACGTCATPRLQAAGADTVYRNPTELVQSLQSGAADLIRAGLPPASLG
jgi:beta-phosphoglucomutase-like phosphatase (HAD superfamily)